MIGENVDFFFSSKVVKPMVSYVLPINPDLPIKPVLPLASPEKSFGDVANHSLSSVLQFKHIPPQFYLEFSCISLISGPDVTAWHHVGAIAVVVDET